jgi:tryptophan 2,3-dioxygenase
MSKESITIPNKSSITYGSYLKVSELLALQEPLAVPRQQDEVLFIVVHQVYELWFKQILHELQHALTSLESDQLMAATRTLKRVITIQQILTQQVDVLETMTPVDFNRFRDKLNPASGFQSLQFRLVEFALGLKNRSYLKYHKGSDVDWQLLNESLNSPSLYDRFLAYLSRRGLNIPKVLLERDVTQPYESNGLVEDVFDEIYRDFKDRYDLYITLETLIELDEKLILWRYRHVAMVERMIGMRQGTGGSLGVPYLATTLNKKCFPELWSVRNRMGLGEY